MMNRHCISANKHKIQGSPISAPCSNRPQAHKVLTSYHILKLDSFHIVRYQTLISTGLCVSDMVLND